MALIDSAAGCQMVASSKMAYTLMKVWKKNTYPDENRSQEIAGDVAEIRLIFSTKKSLNLDQNWLKVWITFNAGLDKKRFKV